MNELQVVVKQQVGKINWNFEELKTALAAEMEKYTGIVYDDDSIADAKNTVAYLRKLKDSVEERRKEVKKECLKPYDDMEKQVKELTQLIDEPINTIAKQVKDYEEEQRKKKKEEILDKEIEDLIQERQAARKAKDFAKADELRDKIGELGYIVEETRQGTKIKKK